MKIIAAIDLIDGKCVRLSKGNFDTAKTYAVDPLEMARQCEETGITHLHVVDLDGARQGKITQLRVLEKLAKHTTLEIDYGGGITGAEDVRALLNAGAARVSIGTLAVKKPEKMMQLIETFGPDTFMLGADVQGKQLAVRGWTEVAEITVIDFLKQYKSAGIRRFFCTDISRDGMLAGTSLLLYKEIMDTIGEMELIASGGVHHISELDRLKETGVWGVIIGKALYEGAISLSHLKNWLLSNS